MNKVAGLDAERRTGGVTRERSLEIMGGHLGRREAKLAELGTLADYLRAKIAWQKAGGRGAPPTLQGP